jgi:hypothetical protein
MCTAEANNLREFLSEQSNTLMRVQKAVARVSNKAIAGRSNPRKLRRDSLLHRGC